MGASQTGDEEKSLDGQMLRKPQFEREGACCSITSCSRRSSGHHSGSVLTKQCDLRFTILNLV